MLNHPLQLRKSRIQTFDTNQEQLTLYGYMGDIDYPDAADRMSIILEEEEDDDGGSSAE